MPLTLPYRRLAMLFLLALPACQKGESQMANNLVGGDTERGKAAIHKYGCGSCHTIPGVRGARSKVGPNLSGIAARSYVAGVVTNSPDNMISWIENPPAIDSKTAMPYMGVTERDARDIATYLYTLKEP